MASNTVVRACLLSIFIIATFTSVHAADEPAGGQPPKAMSALSAVRLPDLSLRVPAVKGKMTLAKVAEVVREATKANVVIDAAALTAAGVKPEAEFELDLRDVKVEQLLRVACRMQGGPALVSFACEEDLITITTAEKANGLTMTRMYPVADLLVAYMRFGGALAEAGRPKVA